MSNSAAAQEPSMEEILASIRRIITDEEGATGADQKALDDDDSMKDALETDDVETEDSLLSSSQPMSPDDLDALFAPDTDDNEGSAKPEPAKTKPVAFQAEDAEPVASEEDESAGDEVMELTAAEIEDDASDLDGDDLELVEGMDVFFDEVEEEAPIPKVAAPVEAAPAAPEPAKASAARQSNIENLISNQAANSVSQSFSSLSSLVVQSQAKTMEDLLKEMLRPMLQSWLDENLPTLVETMVAAEIRRLSGKK